MTRALDGRDVARRINEAHAGAAVASNDTDVWVEIGSLTDVAGFLRDTPGLDFATLTSVTAVDYVEHFELVYHLLSMRRNHSVVVKTRLFGRDEPAAPSLVEWWPGADLQEREIWDLMGIRFESHPNLKRILLWEGYPGHPLRKDYLG